MVGACQSKWLPSSISHFLSPTTLPFPMMNSNALKLSAVIQYHKWRKALQPPTIIYIACSCVLKLNISLQSSNSEQHSGAITSNNFRHPCNENMSNLFITKISLVKTHTQDSQMLSFGYTFISQCFFKSSEGNHPITDTWSSDTTALHPQYSFKINFWH